VALARGKGYLWLLVNEAMHVAVELAIIDGIFCGHSQV
jgi:hypothetical protein